MGTIISGVIGFFRSFTLTAWLVLAIALLGIALMFALIELGDRGGEIRALEAELVEAAKWQEAAQDRIREAEQREGLSAADAAKACAAAGSDAFDQGAAFGLREGMRRCAAQ